MIPTAELNTFPALNSGQGCAAMGIEAHNQTGIGSQNEGSVACGASCIMCALKEFNIASEISDKTGKAIYDSIKKGPEDESNMSGVVAYCSSHGMHCDVIVSEKRVEALTRDAKVKALYDEFVKDLKKAGITPKTRSGDGAFSEADFGADARLMLVVMFFDDGKPKTHWVLARKDRGHIEVMNPDGGINAADDGILEWMNSARVGETREIKAKQSTGYVFTGIALRLTKG